MYYTKVCMSSCNFIGQSLAAMQGEFLVRRRRRGGILGHYAKKGRENNRDIRGRKSVIQRTEGREERERGGGALFRGSECVGYCYSAMRSHNSPPLSYSSPFGMVFRGGGGGGKIKPNVKEGPSSRNRISFGAPALFSEGRRRRCPKRSRCCCYPPFHSRPQVLRASSVYLQILLLLDPACLPLSGKKLSVKQRRRRRRFLKLFS